MKTRQVSDEEIVARLKELDRFDPFRFGAGDLASRLSFETLSKAGLLKEGATREAFPEEPITRDAAFVLEQMKEYMRFAWDKANNRRGISATRSLEHMRSWLFLLGLANDELDDFLTNYENYGKPQLRAICEAFGWDWRAWDDGAWVLHEFDTGVPAPEKVPAIPLTLIQ